jgi:histidine ammonia-lyase
LLRELLADSEIRESHRYGDPRVQDAYALRCMPQVHGPVADAIEFAAMLVGREINAATDNPLVFENGELLSGGNFHGQAVALALDMLAIVMTNLATISERRIDRLVHPDLNQGLPPFLTRDAGVCSGFMMAQVTAAALVAENRMLCHPASIDSIPTSANQEDHVSMATHGARRLGAMTANALNVVAIEFLAACQGIDLRAPLKTSARLQGAYEALRLKVPFAPGDRLLALDIEASAAVLRAPEVQSLAETLLPSYR